MEEKSVDLGGRRISKNKSKDRSLVTTLTGHRAAENDVLQHTVADTIAVSAGHRSDKN